VKRRELLRRLEKAGCELVREGARHTIYLNPESGRTAAVPRHAEIKEHLAARILDELGAADESETQAPRSDRPRGAC
jgi:predicted RNA binding protein YcfA (HicA-like mRNA interferase family)